MASALATDLRCLYSDADFEGKLEASQRLAAALEPGEGTAARQPVLPPLVAAHYLRSLLDWATGLLTKAEGSGGKKHRSKQSAAAAQASAAPRVQPGPWRIICAALASTSVSPSRPPPASLLPAATTTLQALAESDHTAQAAATLPHIATLLQLAAGNFADAFRPSLEHAVAVAQAALAGRAAAATSVAGGGQEAWQPVALATCRLLHAAAAAHPAPRKVFEAAMPRLLLPLAQAAFAGDDRGSSAELVAECRALLDSMLFNQAHVAPLAEAAASSAADGEAAPRSYAAQLLPALRGLLDKEQLPLALLPWLAGRYHAALLQHRRAAQTQAAIAAATGGARPRHAPAAEDGQGQQPLPAEGAAQRGTAGEGAAGASADFEFWAALCQLLLVPLLRLAGDPAALAVDPRAALHAARLLRGLAALAACLKQHHLYRPTQDAAGAQRALLQRLTDAALGAASAARQRLLEHPGPGAEALVEMLEEALEVVEGVLAVEHRPAQARLGELWPLLWAGGAGSGGGGGGGGGGQRQVQSSVACSLVAAYGELRQLEVLLQSLAAALAVAPGPAAAAVLAAPAFRAALGATVAALPSGQVPAIVRFASATVLQLLSHTAPGGCPSLLLADVLGCCLGSLRVDLSMALAAADAAQALVAPLPGQHAKLSTSDVAADGRSRLGGSYFAALLSTQPAGKQAVPELLPLLQAVLPAGRGGIRGDHRLAHVLLQAAQQRLDVLDQQQAYQAHLCPVVVLPGEEERALDQGAVAHAPATWLDRPISEQEREQELGALATLIAAAAAAAASAGDDRADDDGGSGGGASWQLRALSLMTLEGANLALLELSVQLAPVLQRWAAALELQQLLRACLRHAAGGHAPRPAPGGAQERRQQLSLQLLRSPGLLEWGRFRAQLLPVAAAELYACLSDVAAGVAALTSCKKRKKAAADQGTPEAGAADAAAAGLLKQLRRLGEGKAAKTKALRQAVDGGLSSLVALVGALLATPSAEARAGGSAEKQKQAKRKRRPEAEGGLGGGDSAAARLATQLARAEAVLETLAQQPVSSLEQPAAAGMAAAAAAALLLCLQGCAQQLEAGCAAVEAAHLAASGLEAAAACMRLLDELGVCSTRPSEAWTCQLPNLLQAACTAAGSIAAAAGGMGGAAVAPALARVGRHSQSLMAAHAAACLHWPAREGGEQAGGSLRSFVRHLSRQVQQVKQQPAQAWAAALLAEAVLLSFERAAAAADAGTGSSDHQAAAADEICCGPESSGGRLSGEEVNVALLASICRELEPAMAAASAAAAGAAAVTEEGPGDDWAGPGVLGSSYGSLASLLLVRCSGLDMGAGAGTAPMRQSDALLGALGDCLREAAAVLGAGQACGSGRLLLPQPAACQLLRFVGACCTATHLMKPAPSASHFSSLSALVLHQLAVLPTVPAALEPSRRTLPFAALFPAAGGGDGSAPARRSALDALRALVAGCDRQQLAQLLRYAEAALHDAGQAGGGGGGGGLGALPLCELALMLLEAGGSGRQQRVLGQHAQRLAEALTAFVSGAAHRLCLPPESEQGASQQEALHLLQRRILAAAAPAAGDGGAQQATVVETPPCDQSMDAEEHAREPAAAEEPGAAPLAEVATLCTALRACESLVAQPKAFQLTPHACTSVMLSIVAVWSGYALAPPTAGREPRLPGFRYRLAAADGAALFCGSCHLLTALLRHRAKELQRSLPTLLQAAQALLRFLVATEVSAALRGLLPEAARRSAAALDAPAWRVECAEGLAGVMAEVAALKASTSRYCPHLLADYLTLVASPLSPKSKHLLGFVGLPAPGPAGAAAAAAEARLREEAALAGEPLCPASAGALRQGAYALYGACSAAEVQYLYASLGGKGAGAWRAALAQLKADFEKHHKYTGKDHTTGHQSDPRSAIAAGQQPKLTPLTGRYLWTMGSVSPKCSGAAVLSFIVCIIALGCAVATMAMAVYKHEHQRNASTWFDTSALAAKSSTYSTNAQAIQADLAKTLGTYYNTGSGLNSRVQNAVSAVFGWSSDWIWVDLAVVCCGATAATFTLLGMLLLCCGCGSRGCPAICASLFLLVACVCQLGTLGSLLGYYLHADNSFQIWDVWSSLLKAQFILSCIGPFFAILSVILPCCQPKCSKHSAYDEPAPFMVASSNAPTAPPAYYAHA
eukprot:scaffold20.g7879.t1